MIQFVKAAIFNAKQTDPRNFKTVSSSDIQKDIGGMMNGYMDVAIKGMYDKLSTGAFGKTVGEFEDLSGITLSPRQKEAYALLADMK